MLNMQNTGHYIDATIDQLMSKPNAYTQKPKTLSHYIHITVNVAQIWKKKSDLLFAWRSEQQITLGPIIMQTSSVNIPFQ